jgi:hypothetical protein
LGSKNRDLLKKIFFRNFWYRLFRVLYICLISFFCIKVNFVIFIRNNIRYEIIRNIPRVSRVQKTEAQGINILRKAQVEDGEKSLPDGTSDRSVNQKNVPIMAYMLIGIKNLGDIVSVLNEFNELDIKNRIKPIQLSGQSLKIGEKVFQDFLSLLNLFMVRLIHSLKSKNNSVADDFSADKEALWSGQGIEIYDGLLENVLVIHRVD